mmetsp:Transcript_14897/g.18120  ORF Transcript_14897/g.18120 Transcript_14897/m.18120 type:complete len:382 (+) Transcript_14897:54-1199(+)
MKSTRLLGHARVSSSNKSVLTTLQHPQHQCRQFWSQKNDSVRATSPTNTNTKSVVYPYPTVGKRHYHASVNHPVSKPPLHNHSLFETQIQELDDEKDALSSGNMIDAEVKSEQTPFMGDGDDAVHPTNKEHTYEDDLEELKNERDQLYGFTDTEVASWSNPSATNKNDSKSFRKALEEARRERDEQQVFNAPTSPIDPRTTSNDTEPESGGTFTHLSPGGDAAKMVDVGSKTITRRRAVARSSVVFPPEVMKALHQSTGSSNNATTEITGPKGPIFATARLAGIMGAKRTSDLIPLCHPLPLDTVNVTIQLRGNVAVIECECAVTHRTGVEMEALTGASVAALTIYDMVKAISHNVRIEGTVLVAKEGGKRTVGEKEILAD